ncbi:MAG: DegT/DnrJ/EryC1/StrS family aminotransferase [Actinomycetota bacterium]|nr:DegT/DnrJ/EryC1/StrS family aminotransferase [Actinomycetota bacterium]
MPVPLFDTETPLEPLRARVRERVARVLDAGRYILGPEVEAFEAELARYLGVRNVIGVANGTEAITIALRALGVGDDDEVVVPSFTFYASAEAIPPTGARPVFCDVDPVTFCVTPDTVRAAMTPRTKAIVAVDLFGNVAPIPALRELGVPVLEDAAQAAGSTLRGRHAGSLGDAATFSFFPSKNLGGFGDGGAVVTDDDAVAERVRTLRFHGSRDKVSYEEVGYNSRLDEIQAAILRVLLPELDGWCAGRRAAARHYAEAGLGELVGLPTPVDGADPAWHLYVIRHSLAERLGPALDRVGIGQRAYYRTPVHRQPAMRPYAGGLTLPGTEAAARMHLALPLSPVLSRSQAIEVVSAIRSARA